MIHQVDEFVLFDDVQYTDRDWRNRNRIKTASGSHWITIPIEKKNYRSKKINEIKVIYAQRWTEKHWRSIEHNYSRSPYFKKYASCFQRIYESLEMDCPFLSQVNERFITTISALLGIQTKISRSSDFELIEGKSERLLAICLQAKATHYLSGPAAKAYLDEDLFKRNGIKILWMDYSDYVEYPQLYPPFEHAVSILDLIFNTGPRACNFMKSFQKIT